MLADEINRATPKTQSALLKRCRKHASPSAARVHKLEEPFFVMATQNPIEQEGTYPLPEAQLDRFFFKLVVGYSRPRGAGDDPRPHDARAITIKPDKVMDGAEITQWQQLIREVILAPARAGLRRPADRWPRIPKGQFALPITNQYLRCGASPRGAQALVLAAKVRALLEGRFNVSFEDVRRVYLPALRHRVILNFEAQAEGIDTDQVLLDILEKLPRRRRTTPPLKAVAVK